MVKYLMRFDDVNPRMDWEKFYVIKNTLEKYNIKSILGVVPKCEDLNLMVSKERIDYFSYLKKCKYYGDVIAQHGYKHIYDSNSRGIFANSNASEFAGHTLDIQIEKLTKGKYILNKHSLWEPVFMAPAHSFDENTLKALKRLSFNTILDGFSLFPYKDKNLIFIPQIFSKPLPSFFSGISQLCIHVNTLREKELIELLNFIKSNHKNFISINDININNNKFIIYFDRKITSFFITVYRFIRYFLKIVKNNYLKILCLYQRLIFSIRLRNMKIYKWHLRGTFRCRKYKTISLEIINSLKPDLYIDVGCGLGEILSKVKLNSRYKIGYDIDSNLEKCIAKLFKNQFIFFKKEKELFEYISKIKKIDSFIVISMLNFAHNLTKQEVEKIIKKYRKKIGPFILLIDSIYSKEPIYKFNHHHHFFNHDGLIKYLDKVDKLRSIYCLNIE